MDDTRLEGKHIALLATDGFEDLELTQPLDALRAEGAIVTIISDGGDVITGENDTTIDVDESIEEVDASEFEALLLPGGVKNPDKLRMDETAVIFVRHFFDQHKPVAAICHAPWLLVEQRLQLFDQPRFQYERSEFAARMNGLDMMHLLRYFQFLRARIAEMRKDSTT